MNPHRILPVLLALAVGTASAQTQHGPLSFGVEFGLLSNVRIAYRPWSHIELQVGAGSALPNNDSYVETVCASLAYVFDDQPTSAIVRLSGYSTDLPGIYGITAMEVGLRHYVSGSISSYGFLGPGLEFESIDRPRLTFTVGVGFSVHLP